MNGYGESYFVRPAPVASLPARTLAAKAGAGPTKWQEPSVYSGGGAEQLFADLIALQQSPTRQREIDDAYSRWWLELVEQSGVGKTIREGGVIRSIDYVPAPLRDAAPYLSLELDLEALPPDTDPEVIRKTQDMLDQHTVIVREVILRTHPPAR